MENKIYAIDFDGTLCEDKFPEIGESNDMMIEFCKRLKQEGNSIILWTSRAGKYLDDAVDWCKKRGLEFDAVNENLPSIQEQWGTDTRKVFCDYYIDDKNLSIETIQTAEQIRMLAGLK